MYLLKDITSSGGGDRVILRLVTEDRQALLTVRPENVRRFGLKAGCSVSEDIYEQLSHSAELEAAVRQGLSILSYGTNSPGRLAEKLIHRGVSRENAEAAVAELIEKGYIDEEKDIMRLCDSMISKKYGPRKILVALRGRGYGREALAVAEGYLSDTDFSVVCESLIATKIKKIPENRDEMKKLIAKLTALGYNVSDVKKALSRSFGEE